MSAAAPNRSASTAMQRVELSRPIRLAIESNVIRHSDDVFDYGCGRGTDIAFLNELGIDASGWDPNHRADAPLRPAAIVNLGYVINVIEQPVERILTLKRAFNLASRALIVSVRTIHEAKFLASQTAHSDGVLTGTDTFQKFFTQAEARGFIDDTLDAQSTPLAPGVFAVFRDESAEQEWLDTRSILRQRVRRLRRIVEPRKSIRDRAYEENRKLLGLLEEFIADHGRLPAVGEVGWQSEIKSAFGTIARAFQVIRHVADEPWWEAAADDRREELLVRFAIQRIRRLPKFSALPSDLRTDIKELFGGYKAGTERAEQLLFSIGSPEAVKSAVGVSAVGKRTPEAFYIHVDAADLLPPLLRVFIGAAETFAGDIQGATLVKIHLDKPRVSWLMYPEFDTDPHPSLAESWVVDFRALDIRPCDYRGRENPPVLHRKELFISPDDTRYERFKRLTTQEERHGLLEESHLIGTRRQWQTRLDEKGWTLRGNRLLRAKTPTTSTA